MAGDSGKPTGGERQGTGARYTSSLTADEHEAFEALVEDVAALAQAARDAQAGGRAAIAAALAPVDAASEAVALAFATHLGTLVSAQRDGAARTLAQDALDLALAIGELDPRAAVAREARKSRMRLRNVGAISSLEVPAAEAQPSAADAVAPQGERAADSGLLDATAADAMLAFPRTPLSDQLSDDPDGARLVEAYATRSREEGELTLVTGWQEGQDANILRGYIFRLSFWRDGVGDVVHTEPLTRRRFAAEALEPLRTEAKQELVPITWAWARRLLLEALDVNTWRGSDPSPDFQRFRAQLTTRLIGAPATEAQRALIDEEQRRAAQDGDLRLVAGNLDPDETLVNWLGAWSFGDYALTYDLLAGDHPLRRSQTRDAYIALRRQWFDEAKPSAVRVTLAREQAQRANALWTPSAATSLAGERKEFEAFWSLIVTETPLAGQLDEMPMATLSSATTGRHWYWTGYTLARDRALSVWRISRNRDEGAMSQALKLEELRQRLTEAHEAVERVTRNPPPDPRSDAARDALLQITGAMTSALHYGDAQIVRLPLDEGAYQAVIDDARSLGNHERAAALLEKMRGRFADNARVLFELGAERYLVAEQLREQGQIEAANEWLERAVATLTELVEATPSAEYLQGLGEALMRQGHFSQAESRFREALALDAQRAAIYSDLADALLGRLNGENLDEAERPGAEELPRVAREVIGALRDAQRLDPATRRVATRMAAIYEALGLPDDALIALEDGVRQDAGDAEAHYLLGSLYLSRRQPLKAVASLETAVQLAPAMLEFRLRLAACYAALDRISDATRELDVIDRVQPGIPQVAELRGLIAQRRKQRP